MSLVEAQAEERAAIAELELKAAAWVEARAARQGVERAARELDAAMAEARRTKRRREKAEKREARQAGAAIVAAVAYAAFVSTAAWQLPALLHFAS